MLSDHGGEVVLGNPNAHIDMKLDFTIILNPKKGSKCLTDEIFGPIWPMITYKNFDDVVNYIKNDEKPLAMYYFGDKNSANFKRLEKETSSGSLVVNDCLMQIANVYLPFGGVGASGYGRYHGIEGFRQFSNPRSMLINTVTDYYPFNVALPPISEFDKKGAMMGIDRGAGIWSWRGLKTKFIKFLFILIIIACYFALRPFNKERMVQIM